VSSSHYTYRALWSPEDGEYIGLCAEFPSLSWLAPTAHEAIAGIEQLVADIITDMAAGGETAPAPLTERTYSGKLLLRTSPALHQRLTLEAAEQGVSINQWVVQKLAATP
jgi:predicted HicB family RNase H-like nuclease